MILFSVIIPTYNSQNTIERCIRSVINQSLDNLEIICIDDGSRDNTVQILKKFRNKKIKIIKILHTGKPNQNSNLAIKKAKGKFICFLDSDDYWISKNKLLLQKNLIQKTKLKACCTASLNKAGYHLRNYQNFKKKIINFFDISFDNIGSHSSLIVEKNFIKKVDYFSNNTKISTFYDFHLKLKICSETKIAYLQNKTVLYNDNQKFSNRSKTPNRIKMLYILYCTTRDYFFKKEQYTRFYFLFLIFLCLRSTRMLKKYVVRIFI